MSVRRRSYFTLFVLACSLLPAISLAATFVISPASGSHVVGDTFAVSVRVSSSDQSMNAASGVVNFSSDILQVVSLSKSSSIIGLWVQEPSFSNSVGTVNFEGIVLNPGFIGSSGNVISITFKAKGAGAATINITGGSVLANDGNGTEILTSSSGATITVEHAAIAPAASAPSKTTPTPSASAANPAGLEVPIITNVTTDVALGGVAQIVGSSVYPGATVHLTLRHGEDLPVNLTQTVSDNGIFTFVQVHTLPPGDYTGSVYVEQGGVRSASSTSFVIHFGGIPLSTRITDFFNQPGVVLVFSILIAFALGMACARFLLGVLHHADKNMHAALRAVDGEVHEAFFTLHERINRALEELEKESESRELTAAEKRFVREMTSTIKDTEKIVATDIREGEE